MPALLAQAAGKGGPQTHTLFGGAGPADVSADEGATYNLGMVFTADVDGEVVGARVYYPGSPHTMTVPYIYLWLNADGALLASKATGGITPADGWNEIPFDAPVSIAADSQYVVGYRKPANEDYPYQHFIFSAGAVNNAPLHGIAAAADARGFGNGRFVAAPAGADFPTGTFNAAGYGVDVLFRAG